MDREKEVQEPFGILTEREILDTRLKNVELVCRPQDPPLTWNDFQANCGAYAIALDGYVNSAPKFDDSVPCLNLDHHTEVDRLSTRATCDQVRVVIRQKLFSRFRDQNGEKANVYVNDCDEDVCLSWFLLKYAPLAEKTFNPRLNRLISVTDAMDTTAGAYPFPADTPILEEIAWIYEPYRKFRLSGELDKKNPEAYETVIHSVEERIIKYLTGKGEKILLDTRYNRVGGNEEWAMVEEIGGQARTGMFSDGINAFVSVRKRPDNAWNYVLGRMSAFVPFDIPKIFDVLNETEHATTDRWGGSNTIGGSPRVHGSKLNPQEVEDIVNKVLHKTTIPE